MRFIFVLPVISLLFACPPKNETSTEETTETPVVESVEQVVTTPFAVHEWGLLRITTTDSEIATSGFELRMEEPESPREREFAPRKPIIYLHPQDGFEPETEISIEVGLANGTLHEVWPVAEATEFGSTHTFGPLRIMNESCTTENVPTLESPFCAAIMTDGGVCETAEMREYLRPVQHCLQTPVGNAPVLLYNGILNSAVVPVSIVHNSATSSATVTNTGSFPVGPLWAVSVAENTRHYHRIDQLQPNESQTFLPTQHTFGENQQEALVSDISTALIELGLNENEAADFIDAWRPNILAPRASNASPNLPWLVFGFFDSSFIDATLPITITPTPAEITRVLAFSLETQVQQNH